MGKFMPLKQFIARKNALIHAGAHRNFMLRLASGKIVSRYFETDGDLHVFLDRVARDARWDGAEVMGVELDAGDLAGKSDPAE